MHYVMNKLKMEKPMTPAFKDKLDKLIMILKPFKKATDMIQQDKVTLIAVHKTETYIRTKMKQLTEQNHVFTNAIESTLDFMTYQWNQHTNMEATAAAVYFSDTNAEAADPTVMEWIIDKGSRYVKRFHSTSDETLDDIKSDMFKQLNAYNTRSAPFDNVAGVWKHSNGNAREFWSYYVGKKYALVYFAIALLSITPTEASAERTFSQQEMIHRLRRNRLLEETIRSEMMIKFNTKTTTARTAHDSDIESDIDEPDADDIALFDETNHIITVS